MLVGGGWYTGNHQVSVLELGEDLVKSMLLSWHLGSPQVLAPGFPLPHLQDRKP